MAKKDIVQLLEEAKKSLLRKPEVVRALDYNKNPHIFIVDVDKIKAQLLTQIGKTRTKKLTDKQNTELDLAVQKYAKSLYGTFANRPSKVFDYKVNGSETRFNVLVTAKNEQPTSDIFRKIYEIRTESNRLNNLAKTVSKIFSRDSNVTPESLKHIFDLGHVEGTSVSEKIAQQALNNFSRQNFTSRMYPELDTILNLNIKSLEENQGKSFIVTVTDESYSANRSKATKERIELNAVRKAVNEWLIEYGDAWFNQGGSRSAIDIVSSSILLAAKKSGGKVNSKGITKRSLPSSANTKITRKANAPKVLKDDTPLPIKVETKPNKNASTSQRNWLQLLPLINNRLPDVVRKNMNSPKLVNRTGRFAESAKVINVEQTRQGFPSFVFDYQRDPYDVFDRTLGKSPWNTTQRDPRTLVDQSIREIVREMAIGRFFTRRA